MKQGQQQFGIYLVQSYNHQREGDSVEHLIFSIII